SGQVKIFGDENLVRARRHVGAIVEIPAFHTWLSGLANLRQACAYANYPESEIPRVLARVGLTERARDRAGQYSLGMKQRLGIARALLGRPRLLMLDEPTNGLDPRGMAEMRDLIRSLALHDNITVFISSHLLNEVQAICNRVGIIQEGQFRAEGLVDELLSGAAQGRQTFLEVAAADMDALGDALAEIEGVNVLGPGSHGRIRVQYENTTPGEINRRLGEGGVYVDVLVPDARDLEDVFLEVTR
ncbi:MAG: ATP-binding cassette domain-containing protein, partial [Proteobacteria bacterium]|nr:ATP-binding cassette domain-containing protein [Pseudomonadota bacterium]